MSKLKPYAHYFIVAGLALLLMAISQLGQNNVAWADGTNFQTVPTRTPTPNKSDDDEEITSEIIGTVMDLSTGLPGDGVYVRLNDIEVRTDHNGKYSLSGLRGGEFTLVLTLEGGPVAAQGPVVVTVDGRSRYTVDLNYYSNPNQAPVAEAPVEPVVEAQAEPATGTSPEVAPAARAATEGSPAAESESPAAPEFLPVSGAVALTGWAIMGIGLASILLGVKLKADK